MEFSEDSTKGQAFAVIALTLKNQLMRDFVMAMFLAKLKPSLMLLHNQSTQNDFIIGKLRSARCWCPGWLGFLRKCQEAGKGTLSSSLLSFSLLWQRLVESLDLSALIVFPYRFGCRHSNPSVSPNQNCSIFPWGLPCHLTNEGLSRLSLNQSQMMIGKVWELKCLRAPNSLLFHWGFRRSLRYRQLGLLKRLSLSKRLGQ